MKTKTGKLDQLSAQAHALQQSGDLNAAEALCRKLLRKMPSDIETLLLLGTLKMQQGDFAAGVPLLRQVLALRPRHIVALNNLGLGLSHAGHHREALSLIEQALELQPSYGDALNNYGLILGKLERVDEAEAVYRRLIALEPQRVDGFYNLGLSLKRREQWDEAETCLTRALEIAPSRVETLSDLGVVYHNKGRLADAVRLLRRALALRPDFFDAQNNLAACLLEQGQPAEAVTHYRAAAALRPEDTLPRWNCAFAELTLGDLNAGWTDYELRWHHMGGASHPPFPVWLGEDLSGRSILVYPEQGIGDEILFASCIPDVLAQAERVVIICEQRLGALYTRSFPTAAIYAAREPNNPAWRCNVPDCDYQSAVGSLPRLLRTRIADFPDRAAYLRASPDRTAEWRARLAAFGEGPKVGIGWRSGLRSGVRNRYYTPIATWGPILTQPGVTFINLQYDDCAEELAEARALFGVEIVNFPALDLRNDQDGLAALMMALDVVVSAPTAVSELAAALGVPVLRYALGWTSLGTDYMPWHPTMQLFYYQIDGNETPWDEVVARMAAALCERLAVSLRAKDLIEPVADPAETLAQALAVRVAGHLDEAERLCRQVLTWHPNHTEAWHLLGVVLRERGAMPEALAALEQAHLANPQEPTILVNYGRTLQDLGRGDEALQEFRTALALDGNCLEARLSLGELLDVQGTWDEALSILQPALTLAPNDSKMTAEVYYAIAQPLHHQRRLAEAEQHLREAVRLSPEYPGAHNGLGNVLRDQSRFEEALVCYQAALILRPDLPEFHNNLGNVLRELNRLPEAETAYREALGLRPDYSDAWSNLGNLLHERGANLEAIQAHRRALELTPDDAVAHMNIGPPLLFEGELTEGWNAYEWRWRTGAQGQLLQWYPDWNGEDLAGRNLLVLPEQGLGDEILFASCIPDVLARARQVVLVCQQRLAALYARSFPTALIVAMPSGIVRLSTDLPTCDFQIAVGSLPRLVRARIEDFPDRPAYLQAELVSVESWRVRLAGLGPGLKIGICWRSGLQTGGRHRYYTALTDWEPILKTPNVTFINLQYDDCAAELADAQNRFGVVIHQFPDLDVRDDQDGLAALMTALDGVISAPTAVSELAAALGVLVLRYALGWTSLGTHDMPWHPTMQLFKAVPEAPWGAVTSAMAAALGEWVAQAEAKTTTANHLPLQFVETRQGSMLVAGADQAAHDLLQTGEYAPEAVALLASLLRPGDWMVEAHAGIGAFTLPLARAVGVDGFIISCEPRRDEFRLLCANLALNGIEQVHVECLALDAANPAPVTTSGSTWLQTRVARFTSIDGLNLPRCDLLRIGKGANTLAVLNGAHATIDRFKPFIHVEARTNLQEIGEWLRHAGYAWQEQTRASQVTDILGYPKPSN